MSLHMTQPPLSKQLMELERELGKQLFLRGKRRITLTKEGMLLRKRAEEIVSLVEKTKAEVSAPDEGISGDLYIGGGETEGMQMCIRDRPSEAGPSRPAQALAAWAARPFSVTAFPLSLGDRAMTTQEILTTLQADIHSTVFATLDTHGLPQTLSLIHI